MRELRFSHKDRDVADHAVDTKVTIESSGSFFDSVLFIELDGKQSGSTYGGGGEKDF